MEFKDYIHQSWENHAAEAQSVFDGFDDGIKLISSNDDIPVMVRLITHICGDHLGLWNQGIKMLSELKTNPFYKSSTESEFSIRRSTATLKMCSDNTTSIQDFSLSDQIRIFAQAAGIIYERGEAVLAKDYFMQALELASSGLDKADPAHRALAVTGNNLACTLEEKSHRSDVEIEFMILAAKTSRKFWEMAGGPSEIAAAEYRVSQSYLQAGQFEQSFQHAQLCLELCEQNKLSDLDYFYAYEAIALVEKQRKNKNQYSSAVEKMKSHFTQLSDDDQKWCQKTMNKFV